MLSSYFLPILKEVFMFINTFRYTPEDVDCRLCTAFTRKDGCTAPRCLYLAERIEAGVVGYEELLRESFPADSVFRWRLRMLLETFDGTLWQNEKHIRRMETQQAVNRYYKRRDTPKYYAVLYLLTAMLDPAHHWLPQNPDARRVPSRLRRHCRGTKHLRRHRAGDSGGSRHP